MTIARYTIIGSDTSDYSEEHYFYVKNPEDKVYRHAPHNTCLKFQNGNLINLAITKFQVQIPPIYSMTVVTVRHPAQLLQFS